MQLVPAGPEPERGIGLLSALASWDEDASEDAALGPLQASLHGAC